VSNGNRWEAANRTEISIPFEVSDLCTQVYPSELNPIDEFYSHSEKLVERSARKGYWQDELVPRLLLLDLVSASEQYFRTTLGLLVGVCPVCAEQSSAQNLAFYSVDYYERTHLGLALVDTSLAGSEGIIRLTKKLTGIEIKGNSSVDVALKGYDRVCHLRHAAVHSRGELSARNVHELDLRAQGRLSLDLSAIKFQVLLAVCQNAVRAYNRFMFQKIVTRWIGERRLTGSWSEDKALFTAVHRLFVSRRDKTASINPYNAHRSLRARIDHLD
jgi:hypothetical protein